MSKLQIAVQPWCSSSRSSRRSVLDDTVFAFKFTPTNLLQRTGRIISLRLDFQSCPELQIEKMTLSFSQFLPHRFTPTNLLQYKEKANSVQQNPKQLKKNYRLTHRCHLPQQCTEYFASQFAPPNPMQQEGCGEYL